jgi:hypothetical protein
MNKYYTEEHKKLCDEMTKRYGAGWDRDKRVKNKIRDAAKQSARNLDNALRIGTTFNIPAKEIFRQATMLKTCHKYNINIDAAFDIIRTGLKKGKTLEQITGFPEMPRWKNFQQQMNFLKTI